MNGIAFEAKDTKDGTWHGYPVGWEKVDASLRNRWIKDGLVKRRLVHRYWTNIDAGDAFNED